MIRLEKCRHGNTWAHLEVDKLTHSILREAKEETKRLARDFDDTLVFCMVPDEKYKLATSWGFKLSRKVEQDGKAYNIMALEKRNVKC